MNLNALVTILLCSHLCIKADDKPLEPREWAALSSTLMNQNKTPSELLEYSEEEFKEINITGEQYERFQRLLSRSGALTFELERFSQLGINIITRADKTYPRKLKSKLKNSCPPLFYTCGNLEILNNDFIGFAGSRSTSENDELFTRKISEMFVEKGFGIVTGGAKGIDSTASAQGILSGGSVVEYLTGSMIQKIKDKDCINAVRDNRMLLISVAKPDSGFNAGIAMMRNKYIYAQSEATVIVKSDYNKGGTWSGATENLKNKWCKEFCWNNLKYNGNQALIKKGAVPIDENWDGNLDLMPENPLQEGEQLSLW